MSETYRLATVKLGDDTRAVVEIDGALYPVNQVVDGLAVKRLGAAPADLQPLLDDWPFWSEALAGYVKAGREEREGTGTPADSATFLPPIAAPGKIVCIGTNYYDHIAEMPIPLEPTYPYAFIKPANNTLRGSGHSVAVPQGVEMMDWEAELAVVIGAECKNVSQADALDVVAGYTAMNDLSARDSLESRPPIGVDWVLHKSHDGFAPMGPYIVPAEFIPDPQKLPISLKVNGVIKQDSNTSDMVFNIAQIIEHLSSIMTLFPGDIISTGCPAGVGHGRKPPEYLKPGDEVRIEIGSTGELVTPIV